VQVVKVGAGLHPSEHPIGRRLQVGTEHAVAQLA
jgi:hypothetical protein